MSLLSARNRRAEHEERMAELEELHAPFKITIITAKGERFTIAHEERWDDCLTKYAPKPGSQLAVDSADKF